jgi:hypothetical protein
MSPLLQLLLLFGLTVLSTISANVFGIRIIGAVNRKRSESGQSPYLLTSVFAVLDEYRRLHPKASYPKYLFLSMALSVIGWIWFAVWMFTLHVGQSPAR